MNFNKYGRTAQLFDYQTMSDGLVGSLLNSDGTITTNAAASSWTITKYIPVAGREFTLQRQASGGVTSICLYDSNQTYITGLAYNGNGTVTVSANTDVSYIRFTYYRTENAGNIMLNEGSTAKPFEPYGNTWHSTPHYIHNTATDTITTLPAVIYADGNNATVGISGNMKQNGAPTPQNPIQPSECGDLETVGEKAGQYKIPILSAGQTTPVYLGEVQTTRRIKKLVLTGEENLKKDTDLGAGARYFYRVPESAYKGLIALYVLCTHYTVDESFALNTCRLYLGTRTNIYITVDKNDYPTIEDYQAYLAQQYAAGTPVTVWYVLATEETGIVNEPLMKIGDYADTVSGISIPTTAGANTLSVDTTLQPSEVSVNYKGWHPITNVHEHNNGAWN